MTEAGSLLFLFATPMEAEPFLSMSQARLLASDPFPLYGLDLPRGGEGYLLLSGMGPDLAQASLTSHFSHAQPRLVVNAGIVGSLSPRLKVGDMVRVARVARVMEDLEPETWHACQSGPWPLLPKARLLTLSQALFHPERRKILAEFGDLVDMEGAAIAEWCGENGLPAILLKTVSDQAGREAREEMRRNLPGLAHALARELLTALPILAAWPEQP